MKTFDGKPTARAALDAQRLERLTSAVAVGRYTIDAHAIAARLLARGWPMRDA